MLIFVKTADGTVAHAGILNRGLTGCKAYFLCMNESTPRGKNCFVYFRAHLPGWGEGVKPHTPPLGYVPAWYARGPSTMLYCNSLEIPEFLVSEEINLV